MKTASAKVELLVAADLPSINPDYIETLNRIHRLPCVGVQINTSHCVWRWQYPCSRSSTVDVTLKGKNAEYELRLIKSAWLTDSSQYHNWIDYKTDVSCIIFSADHDQFIKILEQVLDDQLVVTAVQSSSPGGDPVVDQCKHTHCETLGFSITDDQTFCLAEGSVSVDLDHLEKLNGRQSFSMGSINEAAEYVVTKVPLLIDSLSLSYSEFKSLSINSVIRLQNTSVLADKTHVVLELGSQFISAQIDTARGTTHHNMNSVNGTADIKT